ncbi:AraC family transcriptional regulator [Clostridium cuniculi]|uniref:AraC family transcriptional regulator n=1 Tax=Clostridium cuniculi TaxID=2548455 RepID=UPI001054A515|nr:AraC family transcriptional regulator [Clostridium cuniculi]
MNTTLRNLYSTVEQLAITEGQNKTTIPYLTIYRYIQKDIDIPSIPNPFISLVINGTMRLYFATGISDYTSGQYLISAIDTPISGQPLLASPDSPFLALLIEFSIDDVISVLLDMEGDFPGKLFETEYHNNIKHNDNNKLLEVIFRLLSMNEQMDKLSFMGKHLKREIIFNVISGPYGKQFLQNIVNLQQAGDIYYINNWIKHHYKDPFTVEELAEQSNMSLSSFHQKFKSAVGMGPLQCKKKLRLIEARKLMLDKSMSVTDAALEVGYESVSQFIRDYRWMFGRSPQKDVQELLSLFQSKFL